jgi:deoxyadenosine/deoxycytidine kinase
MTEMSGVPSGVHVSDWIDCGIVLTIVALGASVLEWIQFWIRPSELIAVEGNIASTKSTDVRRYRDRRGWIAMMETVSNRWLEAIGQAPSELLFGFQLTQAAQRHLDIRLAMATHPRGRTIILDRSLYGDLLFALHARWCGHLSDQQWSLYCHSMSTWRLTVPPISRLLYFHSCPIQCKTRVQRRGHADRDVPDSVLRDLHHLHFYMTLWTILQRVPVSVMMVEEDRPRPTPFDVRCLVSFASSFSDRPLANGICEVNWDTELDPIPLSCGERSLSLESRRVHTLRWQSYVLMQLRHSTKLVLVTSKPLVSGVPSITVISALRPYLSGEDMTVNHTLASPISSTLTSTAPSVPILTSSSISISTTSTPIEQSPSPDSKIVSFESTTESIAPKPSLMTSSIVSAQPTDVPDQKELPAFALDDSDYMELDG